MNNLQYTTEENTLDLDLAILQSTEHGVERPTHTQELVDLLEQSISEKNYHNINNIADRLISLEPWNVNFWLALVESTIFSHTPELAMKLLGSMKYMFPFNAEVYMIKAKCHTMCGNIEEAENALVEAYSLDSEIFKQAQNDPHFSLLRELLTASE